MKPEIAKLWVEALRSGKYKQTVGQLGYSDIADDGKKITHHRCCLGVLCDIYADLFPDADWEFSRTQDIFIDDDGKRADLMPTSMVEQWAGAEEDFTIKKLGFVPMYKESFSRMNDEYKLTFEQIATVIECEYLDGLAGFPNVDRNTRPD